MVIYFSCSVIYHIFVFEMRRITCINNIYSTTPCTAFLNIATFFLIGTSLSLVYHNHIVKVVAFLPFSSLLQSGSLRLVAKSELSSTLLLDREAASYLADCL